MTKVPQADRTRLTRLKKKLETRIDIVSSAIDLIKLVAARGNTNLESTLRLTHDLKEEIDEFDERVREIIEDENAGVEQVKEIEEYMADLLERIEEAIPLINLALTTSGANLNGSLPSQVSPGRLLQASDLVNKSNSVFDGSKDLLVGHIFQLTLYSIFYHLKSDNKYEYLLKIKENFDDGRYHEEEDPKEIKLDVSTITRLFFSASGKLLKLEDRSTPVLVLKINKSFGLEETEQENLVEWLAFG
ncbi:Ran-specific GTPase-activating protein 30 [Cyberlindnera fabianii]|uniref:Ran-specific GTPase-activating protein 30 n=1 Tax=Cyberlindnera fabianii TaxID=36022 RepID=A0A1V2L496_CYBFA|nr:Ran-specific GTPase-activating protein 30 [Cyberlindnera fabianii]